MEPKVVGLDVVAYQAAMNDQRKKVSKWKPLAEKASGTVDTAEDSMLVTTILTTKDGKPRSMGSQSKSATSKRILDAKSSSSKHTVTFSYLPEGFMIGAILFCTTYCIVYSLCLVL